MSIHQQQKLIIGDDSGLLSCFEFKKGEPQPVFQLKIFDGPVSCVAVGGNPTKRDKVAFNPLIDVFLNVASGFCCPWPKNCWCYKERQRVFQACHFFVGSNHKHDS
jgi:hypothetical protein